ncbi:MAG: hypothetical protein ACE5GB_02550 [Acidimicrobiales bacterium]
MEERTGYEARWRELGQAFDPVENMKVAASGLEAAGRVLEELMSSGSGSPFGARADAIGSVDAWRELRAELDRAGHRFVELMGTGLTALGGRRATGGEGELRVIVVGGVGTARLSVPCPSGYGDRVVRLHVGDLRRSDGSSIAGSAVTFEPTEAVAPAGGHVDVALRVDTDATAGSYHTVVLADGHPGWRRELAVEVGPASA